MKHNTRILVIAVGLALAAGTTLGQYQSNNDGRARDANNRVGSDGYNSGPGSGTSQVRQPINNNRIITGNVTQGRSFRGPVPYSDSNDMRSGLSGQDTDNFIRDSSGVARPYGAAGSGPQVFYGRGLVGQPGGLVRPDGPTQTYYVQQSSVAQPLSSRFNSYVSPSAIAPLRPGNMYLSGSYDQQTQQSNMVTASPLYGVREWSARDSTGSDMISGAYSSQPADLAGRLRIDSADIQKMREELARSAGETGLQQNLARPVQQPFETPVVDTAGAQKLDLSVSNTVSGDQSFQSIQDRLLVPPEKQSLQYSQLQQRLDKYFGKKAKTDEQVHRELMNQIRAKKAAEEKQQKEMEQPAPTEAAPQEPSPSPAPQPQDKESRSQTLMERDKALSQKGMGAAVAVDAPMAPLGYETFNAVTASPATSPAPTTQPAGQEPLKINSLSEGVSAGGLASVLKNAEDLMRQGRFLDALKEYDLAERVAPNNPLIWLGRAHSELAAGFYTRAEADLRMALRSEPALLMGQYDLKAMIGQDRLTWLVADLKEVARNEPNEPRPLFLLAWVAYNTGNPRPAGDYLSVAERRGGEEDPFYALVRSHWFLPMEQLENTR